MKKTKRETRVFAQNAVNRMLADLLARFPKFRTMVDRREREEWLLFLDDTQAELAELLIDWFQVSEE